MKAFIKEALSENGTASIKRVTLMILLFAFLAELTVDLAWSRLLSSVLCDQLYYAMLATLGCILGINVMTGIKDIKIEQSKNNATVGSPSPTPDTTIVTEKPTT